MQKVLKIAIGIIIVIGVLFVLILTVFAPTIKLIKGENGGNEKSNCMLWELTTTRIENYC